MKLRVFTFPKPTSWHQHVVVLSHRPFARLGIVGAVLREYFEAVLPNLKGTGAQSPLRSKSSGAEKNAVSPFDQVIFKTKYSQEHKASNSVRNLCGVAFGERTLLRGTASLCRFPSLLSFRKWFLSPCLQLWSEL